MALLIARTYLVTGTHLPGDRHAPTGDRHAPDRHAPDRHAPDRHAPPCRWATQTASWTIPLTRTCAAARQGTRRWCKWWVPSLARMIAAALLLW